MKTKSIWYIEPHSSYTNEVISRKLSSPTASCDGILCADGERRDLWECDYGFVARLQRDKGADPGLSFRIFNKEGQHGQIRPWIFPAKKRRKQEAQLLAA